MRIAEIFRSIQGEGRLTCTESIFVRTSGCNLRCSYCDTPYASWKPEGEDLTVAKILDRIEKLRQSPPPQHLSNFSGLLPIAGPVRHVVITGGEPMLFPEIVPLTARLHKEDWHITIETAGTLYLAVTCDLMSISPKLSNSTPSAERDPRWPQRHALQRHVPEVIRRLVAQYDCQLKFVINQPEDCREVMTYLEQYPEIQRRQVLLMPEGVEAETLAEKAKWLEPFCVEHGFSFCPRRQIEWFGSQRGR
jgi:7-carboxy-7-deazaguanine synthase